MGVEVDNLREDVARMDDQLNRETSLRKSLQEEKKTLMAQVQNLVVQLETTRLAVDSTQRELVDVTDHKVRLEGILRDTKSAMQKVTLEQQIEQKSHAQRTAMLEKVISDERAERRNLVNETLEVNSQREDTLDTLRRAQNEAMAGLCWCPPGHMSYKTCWCQGIKVICEYIEYIPCLHSPHSFTTNACTCAAVTALKSKGSCGIAQQEDFRPVSCDGGRQGLP
eukprot:symbB.v1.2.014307.t1/scaffold1045.1/size142133/1